MLEHRPIAPTEVRVKPWMKWFMYFICLVPAGVGVLGFIHQASIPQADLSAGVAVFFLLTAASVWLFPHIYCQCSIVLGPDGISQALRQHRGIVFRKVSVPWENIRHVRFVKLTYQFLTDNQIQFELNTALFNDTQATIQEVRAHLPQRLRQQLDSHDA